MTTYFGFAITDSMFPENCNVTREEIDIRLVKLNGDKIIFVLNPSHVATIKAMKEKFGFDFAIPEKAPIVKLTNGDSFITMSVRGLPMLEGRHEYTQEEIDNAEFTFGLWEVQ